MGQRPIIIIAQRYLYRQADVSKADVPKLLFDIAGYVLKVPDWPLLIYRKLLTELLFFGIIRYTDTGCGSLPTML